jgi:D-arabinose 1-dehydrogenase-like Zn-dependent alcohol dehydrogenase
MASSTRAIVASAPGANHEGGQNWGLQDLTLRPLKDDEVLVQIIATGICHTDLVVTSFPAEYSAMTGVTYPRVAGHEGEVTTSSSTSHYVGHDERDGLLRWLGTLTVHLRQEPAT